MNYYNEIDLSCRRWLRELVKDGLIADGYIDNRPIQEVRAHELSGFTQCHFFAGIGGWPYALRLAGWPDDEPVWTGSCPCQPFSSYGKQMGNADSRHLFPTWRRLIARGQPAIVFGEQVASKLGREWLARVRLEMATLGYATRGGDYCSAGVGAPNLRQRLYWMADTDGPGTVVGSEIGKNKHRNDAERCGGIVPWPDPWPGDSDAVEPLANPADARLAGAGSGEDYDGNGSRASTQRRDGERQSPDGGELGHANEPGRQGRRLRSGGDTEQQPPWSSGTVGILCTDGKTRRIKPEIFPLAARLPGDLGLIRGAGNAINPWVAAKFIRDSMT